MRQLIISNSFFYEKIAILEDGKLEEFFYEQKNNDSYLGNIYKGRVIDILPGMQAAFIDIGLEKNAYLYIDELLSTKFISEKNIKKDEIDNINKVIKKGEELLVQVIRDPIGEKNVSVTTNISLAGKCLALIPKNLEINVSRKIPNKAEKKRLFEIGKKIMLQDFGMVIRTYAEGMSEELINEEYNQLVNRYKQIEKEFNYSYAPKLLMHGNSLLEKVFIEYINQNIDEIYVENKEDKKIIEALISRYKTYNNQNIQIDASYNNLFEVFNVEKQIDYLNNRKIELDNGGSIVIDTTEAMTVIDVNSGSYIGNSNMQDETSLTINIAAMKEIARQLRLRNISGIIIIDFINFRKTDLTDTLIGKAKEFLKTDKAKTKVLGMTKLNLMELTRKRNQENFYNSMTEKCLACNGDGRVPSGLAIMLKLENIIKRINQNTSCTAVALRCNEQVLYKVKNEINIDILRLEEKSKIKISFIGDNTLSSNIIDIDRMGKLSNI